MKYNFQWDLQKAKSNLQKHNVSFEEATSVFDDMLSSTITDPSHPIGKNRFIQIGLSNTDKILVVVFTDRNDIIRIISARIATKQEVKTYEEGNS